MRKAHNKRLHPIAIPLRSIAAGKLGYSAFGLDPMNESAVHAGSAEARTCALVMPESAIYIQNEPANIRMTDALRGQTEQACTALVGTKHDITSELFELDELLSSEASASVIRSRVNRIVQGFRDGIIQMHQLVMAPESASKQGPGCRLAYVLVPESATNILNSFTRTRAAADSMCAEADETRNAYLGIAPGGNSAGLHCRRRARSLSGQLHPLVPRSAGWS